MEELLELRAYLEQQRYPEALALLAELEEMSREDKINKIRGFAKILLLHLIKRAVEQRTARSWDLSIWNAVDEIVHINRRRKVGGHYLDTPELQAIMAEAYPAALKRAALETCEGRFDERELAQQVDQAMLQQQALDLILAAQIGNT